MKLRVDADGPGARMRKHSILSLGACMVHGPMNAYVGHRKLDVRARIGTGAGTPYTHTLGEMLQLIGVLRGDVTLPAEVKRLAGFKAAFQPLPGIGDFGEVEVVLVEASTPVEILYDNIVLQRNSIVQHIIAPLRLAHPQPAVRKLSSRWIFHGLLRQDEEPQTLGRQLAKLVPDSMPLADIARDVLVNARAVRRDVAGDLTRLRATLNRPMAMVTYTYRYMPDGRPVTWPAGFREELLDAAAELELPVFEPWKLVQEHGVARALQDIGHYTAGFDVIMGEALVDFAARTTRRS